MLGQLQQFQILDTALIQSCGYPIHLEHDRFVERYSPLLLESRGVLKDERDLKTVCQAVLKKTKITDYRIGNSQVLPSFVLDLSPNLTNPFSMS